MQIDTWISIEKDRHRAANNGLRPVITSHCFYQPLVCIFTGKYIYVACKSTLFKITFKNIYMTFPQWKDYKKHCMFLKQLLRYLYFL